MAAASAEARAEGEVLVVGGVGRAGRLVARRDAAALTAALTAVGLVAVLAGCGGAPSGTAADEKPAAGAAAARAAGTHSDATAQGGDKAAEHAQPATAAGRTAGTQFLPLTRAVVQTVDVTVRVDDVAKASLSAEHVARSAGGFVADESTSLDGGRARRTATLTLRVPGGALERVLGQLEDLGAVVSRSRSAQDVTDQVVDVDARVATQKASLARVRALLARAKSIAEVVAVESELTKREADLESLQRRQAELADLTSLATVTVTLDPEPVVAPAEPKQAGFIAGLHTGWSALADVSRAGATVLGTVLPFALVVSVVAVPFALLLQRRRRAAIPPTAPPAPQTP